MMNSISIAIISLLSIQSIAGHMEVESPIPRSSRFNLKLADGERNYNMVAPVTSFACEKKKPNDAVTDVKAGETMNFKFYGMAPHNGGSCQFGLSYDEKNFVSLNNYVGNCNLHNAAMRYNMTIPQTASNGKAVAGWFWLNHTGNRELYMNCIDINISGGSGAGVTGPQVAVANVPGYPTIPEDDKGGVAAGALYAKASTITIKA